MSTCSQLFQFALGGCLIGLLLNPALAQEVNPPVLESKPVSAPKNNSDKSGATNGVRNEQASPERLTPSLDKIEGALRDLVELERKGQGQPPNENQKRNLVAQEDMALWAKLMFIATAVAVFLTGVGLYLIGRTLVHTRNAANYAREMVDEAKKTTSAAIRANDAAYQAASAARASVNVAQGSAERQLRAYVNITNIKILWESGRVITITVPFKNNGQTPAYKTHVSTEIKIDDTVIFSAEDGPFDLGPQTKQAAERPLSLSEEVWDGARNRSKRLSVIGKITYWDAFHVERKTTFNGFLSPADDRFFTAPTGNEST